ncbi:hypothetical protein HPB47_022395 [Ixodes persulcatus]|uniref:Uncharacterized protein n=1 Tax=Ixodes persulcatus TaxID=34615 RepID=A0AC60Q9W0_IXOPE|nr:hypothetical protein HPB47_022395 [Ixodes persulcatus]
MTSQPSTPVLAQETGPSCSQQTPADKDHSYHANQETQPGRLNLGKRHSDGDNNSPEASSTPAKLQASQNDDMEQEFTEGDLEGFVLVEHRRQRTTDGAFHLWLDDNQGRRKPYFLCHTRSHCPAAIMRLERHLAGDLDI